MNNTIQNTWDSIMANAVVEGKNGGSMLLAVHRQVNKIVNIDISETPVNLKEFEELVTDDCFTCKGLGGDCCEGTGKQSMV